MKGIIKIMKDYVAIFSKVGSKYVNLYHIYFN
jgi:hypothetical protein